MNDIERELLNYNGDMVTNIENIQSIDKITNVGSENKELFRDLNTFNKNTNTCSNTKFDINNFVKDLENNLDNFDEQVGPKPSNTDDKLIKRRQSFTETLVNITDIDDEKKETTAFFNYDTFNEVIYDFLIKIREPLIIVLLFILLNNKDFIILIYNLPFMNQTDSFYPSLIIRGIILAIIIYFLRK
jgi:hypothetical protein